METFGLVDGPGVRFVVFLQGCAMRCKYCHNPETWSGQGGQEWSPEDLFKHVYRYKSYWHKKGQPNGGITVSGGEPLLQMPFVTEFFRLAKAKGVNTTLDTAGNPFTLKEPFISQFKELMKVTDLVMLDLKEIDEEKSENQLQNIEAGRVDINDVDFSYVPDRKLIENLNLHVKPGQRIAIVGPTGCGKTTIINLLMRFYDVDKGSITIDGKDIRDISRKNLRSSYGMVLQETWLRNTTVRENIAFGKPDATDEEIENAAKASYAHNFIKRLPKGYDTVIGEDGGSLSQGQKQLLCIARVMLCLPPMLILDEATSSIDTRTEVKIQDAFSKMMEGRTTFIVAHRLSTIKEADVILVMKDGKIIEQGNHEELLEKRGFYYKLYNS